MKRLSRIICTIAALLMPLGAVTSAHAALAGFSPNPARLNGVILGGIPAWYQDINGVAVEPCLVPATCGLIGLGDPMFNEALPLSYPGNFPQEAFYSDVVAIFGVGAASARVVLAMEYTFIDAVTGALISANPRPANALGVPFQRHRLILSYPPGVPVPTAGNFTIGHPWGSTVFPFGSAKCVNNAGGQKCSMTRDLPLPGAIPPNFAAALGTGIVGSQSTFVADPLAPAGFLGSATAVTAFTGADVAAGGTNSISVTDGLGNTGSSAALTLLVGKKIGLDVQPGSSHDFGPIIMAPAPAGSSPVHTITITNTTGFSATFPAPLVTAGVDAGDFIISDPALGPNAATAAPFCNTAPGSTIVPTIPPPVAPATSSCSFDITFTPKNTLVPAHAARVATIALGPKAALAANDPPPVTLNLKGNAQVLITTAVASPHGTITPDATVDPVTGGAPAGSPVTFTAAADNKKFKVKSVDDGGALLTPSPTNPAAFTLNTGAVNHTVTATFMQSGDLDADGFVNVNDALKALRIVAGVQQADGDDPDNTAVKVAPLTNGVPAALNAKPTPDIGDVLVILRRVLNLDTW